MKRMHLIAKRKEMGLGQIDLAKKLGLSQSAVSQIENGTSEEISGKALIGYTKLFNKSAEWIETGSGSNLDIIGSNANISGFTNELNGVPVISMVQAGDWTEAVDPYAVGDGEKVLPCPYNHGENTFAVTIVGQSMSPEFKEGLVIFIDPAQMPENKQYCVAKLTDTGEATFKQYIVEDGKAYLKAVNPSWPTPYIPINGNCHIVGRMIGVYQEY